jgi:hypothetical protein
MLRKFQIINNINNTKLLTPTTSIVTSLRFVSSSSEISKTTTTEETNSNSKKAMTRAEASAQRAALAKAAVEFGAKHGALEKPGGFSQPNNNKAKVSEGGSATNSAIVESAGDALSAQREQYEKKKGTSFKVKRKAPWGAQQLRDSWSEDAMARHDKDSVGDRIDREYRYHPEAYLRKYIKYIGLAIPPLIVIAFSVGYYWASGYSVYKVGDFQAILNILRQFDTSPRSALFLPKTAGSLSTPFELSEGDGPRRRRVGAREEYDALVKQYREAIAHSAKDIY